MSNYTQYQKKGRNQGDSGYQKRPTGDPYSNRESRNSDRKYPDNSNSYKGYNSGSYNDNYQSKGNKNYPQNNYKSKAHYPRNAYEEKHDVSQYRRKVQKYTSKDLLAAFEDRSDMPNLMDYVTNNEGIFVFDGQDPVNEEEFKLDPNDAFAPTKSAEPLPKKEEIGGDNKFQLYDLGNQGYDPIADLKKQMQLKREQEGNQDIDEESERYEEDRQKYRGDEEEEFGDGDNFSDIDARFEAKLRSNQYQVTEDVFEELLGGTKKEFDLGELENDQRPDWEDEKVSTTIVEKDKDFFNQNPQLDKRLLVGANHGFEETKTPDTKSMQNQLLQFQAQIKAQQQQQSPVKQQQPIQHLTLQQQLQQQLQINQFQQPQTQPESKLQPTIMKSAEPSVDFFKISFEDDIKYNDDFKNADDERINAAFNQFSFKSNYETDIESFVKTLSVGVPTTFNKTSRLTGLNNPETKIINPQVIEAPKTSHPDFMVQQLPQFKREAPKENTNTNILGGPKKRPTPMYPSFVFRYYSSEYEQQNWYYLDNEEKKCGPFSGKDMDKWYGDGTLPLELKVTIGENNQCKTIKEIADYIVAKTINGDGPPPEKKPKPQNEMIAKLMTQIGDKADLVTAGDHPPLKAKTLDEIEVPVNYEKWAPPLVKVDKKKDHDKNHGDRQHNNYKRNNYHNNNEQGHNNYKNNYQNQNNKYGHNNQNYNQNYQNQGNNYNNEQNKDQNNYMKPKTLVSRPGGNMVQNFNNQSGQPLIPTNNLNQSAPNEATLQIKGLLGMVKPEIKTQQQQQTQIQVNQVPKIDQADFPSLGETYMK